MICPTVINFRALPFSTSMILLMEAASHRVLQSMYKGRDHSNLRQASKTGSVRSTWRTLAHH